MPATSKNIDDIAIWIEKIIDSCEHPLQEIGARKMVQNFEHLLLRRNLYNDFEYYTRVLRDRLDNKFYDLFDLEMANKIIDLFEEQLINFPNAQFYHLVIPEKYSFSICKKVEKVYLNAGWKKVICLSVPIDNITILKLWK